MSVPQTTLALFNQTAADWVDDARQEAVRICKLSGRVTIDDVLVTCPRPIYVHRNRTGMIFKDPVFKCVGFKKSQRQLARGRIVCVWGLHEEFFPRTQLAYLGSSLEGAD